MRMSRWVLKFNEKEILKRIEPIQFEQEKNTEENKEHTICITFIEKGVDPKFYSKIKLTPIESIKFGAKLICMGIESIKNREYKPSCIEIKGFDECIFFIKDLLDKKQSIEKKSPTARIQSVTNLKTVKESSIS